MICDATIVGHLLAAYHVIQVYIQKLSDGFLILTAVFFFKLKSQTIGHSKAKHVINFICGLEKENGNR